MSYACIKHFFLFFFLLPLFQVIKKMSHSPNLSAQPAKGILKKNKNANEDATR